MRELLLYDHPTPCPYLPGETARMPLRQPLGMTGREFDQRLAEGDRRLGGLLYRTQCPQCQACEAIRIPVAEFSPGRTHRRILRKGDALLRLEIGPPKCDQARVDLYNRHKQGRGLAHGDDGVDLDGYYEFLVSTCVKTIEFSYWHEDRLVAVATSDMGQRTLNAVYCYFDPHFAPTRSVSEGSLSLGTYNVLKQIDVAAAWGLDYLYLGYYIAASPHMNYKARFLPHERLIDGAWRRYERAS